MEERKEMAACCSSHLTEEKTVSDFPLLFDEKFDFDLSLSPASANEDEVFVGPVGHKEKCIAVNIEGKKSNEEKSVPACDKWSPLTGEKFVKILKEARLLAQQIETGNKNEQTKISQLEEKENKIIEKFAEDSNSKLKILGNQNIKISPKAVKRETYCVWDSPACQLPPCFQKESDKLLSDDKTDALHASSNISPVKICVSPTKIASLPLTQEQKTEGIHTKATGKLPMAKPSSALGKNNSLTTEKPKQEKHTSISTKRDLNSIGSSEDLISDKSSGASDVFESSCSGSSSSQDKKTLPPPSKPALKKMTYLKPPGVASGVTRKTTSSLSSVSSVNLSLNSSLSISPIGKNGKSSIPSKISVSGSRLPSSSNMLSHVRPTRVSSLPAANIEKSRKLARSASTLTTFSAVSLVKSSASAASSEAVGSAIQRPNSVSSLQKLCQENKEGSATKSVCTKPKAGVLSVPANQTKILRKTGDTSPNKSTSQAISSLGLPFCGTLGSAMAVSTPVKASEDGMSQNSCFRMRSVSMTPASQKRSGLPTPIRRISGFPAVTPKTAPRMAHAASVCPSSSFSTRKTLTAGSKQTKENKTQISSEDDISPPPLLPLALNFSPEKEVVQTTEVVQNELKEAEVQNQLVEEKQTEALLIDIGVNEFHPHTLESESRPLLDLSNTPEVNKFTPLKPVFSGQVKLIDLSSPLITLSPDVNQENLDSPLIKF